ncbi:MAG: hypothetical protein WA051_00455 [Minisyncoccia bacterium]
MRLVITVQATRRVDELGENFPSVNVTIKEIPFRGLVGGGRAELSSKSLAIFIAREAIHARKHFGDYFAPQVATQIIQ